MYKTPEHIAMKDNGDGSKFGVDPAGIAGKDAAIRDAQARFGAANPEQILGYILIVCQAPAGASATNVDEVETVVDFGGSPLVKRRMLSSLVRAVESDESYNAAIIKEGTAT